LNTSLEDLPVNSRKNEHKFLRAALGGLIVALASILIDLSLLSVGHPVLLHQLVGDLIGGLVAALVFLALQLKYEEMHYRFAIERAGIVAELNHHVRNAVFPLCVTIQRVGDVESNRIANDAVERINIALRDAITDAFSSRVDYGTPGPFLPQEEEDRRKAAA
jgi:hypothetical protein